MARTTHSVQERGSGARVTVGGRGVANVATGLPILDHMLALLAEHAGFDLALEVAPGEADAEVAAAGRALGRALAEALQTEGSRRHGSSVVPADEALEASGRPLVVSNVDLSDALVAGLGSDVVARFLLELAEGESLPLHVRLIDGKDTQHVLEAIFKALGVALAQACRLRG